VPRPMGRSESSAPRPPDALRPRSRGGRHPIRRAQLTRRGDPRSWRTPSVGKRDRRARAARACGSGSGGTWCPRPRAAAGACASSCRGCAPRPPPAVLPRRGAGRGRRVPGSRRAPGRARPGTGSGPRRCGARARRRPTCPARAAWPRRRPRGIDAYLAVQVADRPEPLRRPRALPAGRRARASRASSAAPTSRLRSRLRRRRSTSSSARRSASRPPRAPSPLVASWAAQKLGYLLNEEMRKGRASLRAAGSRFPRASGSPG
jgi:hypothetical protein